MVNMVAAHAASIRRHTRELHIETKIVVPTGAFEAVAARDSRLNGYAVTRFEVLHIGAGPDDFAGAFVAQTVC